MRLNRSALRCLGLVTSTASAVYLPQHTIARHNHLQQNLEKQSHAADHVGLEFLDDSRNLDDLFWSLTTEDAIHAFGNTPALELNSHLGRIVLDQYEPDVLAAPSALQSLNGDHPASLEISMSTIGGFPVYHAPIAIGNPAQPFRAWLNMNLNGLYVRSTACSEQDCGRGYTYDPEQSTTRRSLGHRFEVHPKDWTVGGDVSADTLHLVSIDVKNATVGEIDKYEGEDLFYYVMEYVADSALGLAPPNAQTSAYSPMKISNPLYELMKSHEVKHNTLTLTLPSSVQDQGSLKIGVPPQAYDNMIRIPFGNATSSGLTNSWHVPLDSVSLEGNVRLHLPLHSVYGRLDLEPAIRLPPGTTEVIYKAIGATPNSLFYGASIDCTARERLPDLILYIGGHDIKLTRDDYSSEQLVYGHPVCVVAILPSDEEGVAVLGTNLLRKYRVVIDMDQGELGLHAQANYLRQASSDRRGLPNT